MRRFTVYGTFRNGQEDGITVKADTRENARKQAESWYATWEPYKGWTFDYMYDNGQVGRDTSYIVMSER